MNPSALTDTELSDAIESTGAMAARHYAQGLNYDPADARLDVLMAEHERRQDRETERRLRLAQW